MSFDYHEMHYAGSRRSGGLMRYIHLMALVLLQSQMRVREALHVGQRPTEITPSDVRSGKMVADVNMKKFDIIDHEAPSLLDVSVVEFQTAREGARPYRRMNKRDVFSPNHGFQPKGLKRHSRR